METSRTYNIKNNLIFNIIKFTAQIFLQFILRTVLIYYMGVEYLGLNGLFSNIFTFLNLAELGIGTAIVFSMYKPIADGNTEKVKSLQNLYKKFYIIISIVVLCLGITILPFLRFFINGEVSVNINIYVLFVLYLINTLVGYFSAHKRSLLFAHQRNDVENKIKTICLLGMTLLQIIILIVTKNYYTYFCVNIIFTIIECLLVHVASNKLYPAINGASEPIDEAEKKTIWKNVKAISLHKIGSAVVFSTDNILISSMFGLVLLGAYSNYYLIISTLISVYVLLSNALMGSVGNLIASKDKEYVYKKYKQINFMFSILTAFCTICLIVLFQPFISVWTRGDSTYLLNFSTMILLCISFYLGRMRIATGIFKECAGLFKQDQWKALVESIVNLITSIILGIFMGINGVVLGTIISTVIAPIWIEPLVLYKHYFNKNVKHYFISYIRDILITLFVSVICYFICSFIPNVGLFWLIIRFIICICVTAVLLVISYLPTKEFRSTLYWAKEIIFKSNKSTNQ